MHKQRWLIKRLHKHRNQFPIDLLKFIVSFLDWTCDIETFEIISKILKLNPNERNKILAYWHDQTTFEIIGHPLIWKIFKVNGKLHRVYGPAFECDGFREWWICGFKHRLDGPAVEFTNGRKEYWQNGQLHRVDGPAIIHPDGRKEYWQNGEKRSPYPIDDVTDKFKNVTSWTYMS